MDEPGALPEIDLQQVARVRRRFAVAGIVTTAMVALVAGLVAAAISVDNPLPFVAAIFVGLGIGPAHFALRRGDLLERRDGEPGRLHAHDGALFLDDAPLCRREDVTGATLSVTDQGPIARIERRRGHPVELFVPSRDDGKTLLHALGTDVKRQTDAVTAPSIMPSGTWLGAVALFFTGMLMIGLRTELIVGQAVIGLACLPTALALLAATFVRERITVGADGIELRWLWRRKFVPLKDIERVERMQCGVRLHRHDGGHRDLVLQRNVFAPSVASARLDERLQEAIEAHRASLSPAIDPALLDRGQAPIPQWIERLRGVTRIGTFRQAGLVAEELFQIVENAAMPPPRRAAAAVALAPALDDAGKARLRIAADASAMPHLRVALDAAVDDDHATLETALAEVVEEHREHA